MLTARRRRKEMDEIFLLGVNLILLAFAVCAWVAAIAFIIMRLEDIFGIDLRVWWADRRKR